MIHYQLNDSTFALGDTVQGSCQWFPSNNEEARKIAKLTVGWRTEGRGDVDQTALYEAELRPQQTVHFKCDIPFNAHPSYDGELLRIIWEVRVDFVSTGLQNIFGLGKSQDARTFRVVAGRGQS